MTPPPPRRGQEPRPDQQRPQRPSSPGPLPPTSNGRGGPDGRPQRTAIGYGGEVITAAQIESGIMRLSGELETLTYTLAEQAERAAAAEVAYKVKFAKTRLVARDRPDGHGPGGRVSNDEADDHAIRECEAEFQAHLIAAAVYGATRDAMFTKGRQLEALRTIAANIRSQT